MSANIAAMSAHGFDTGPKVYVVSLVRSERRKVITEQFSRYGISFVFVDAVDAAQIDPEHLRSQVDEAAVLRNIGRRLSGPEICCALSHRAVYRAIIEHGEPGALILEDDVQVTSSFLDALDFFRETANNVSCESQVYHLGTIGRPYARDAIVRRRTRINYKKDFSFVALLPCWTPVWGTYGYYITHEAASMLLAKSMIFTVADEWVLFQKMGLVKDIYISIPSVVIHPEEARASSVEAERQLAGECPKRRMRSPVYLSVRRAIKNYLVRPIVERVL